jgi:hypothetical protein
MNKECGNVTFFTSPHRGEVGAFLRRVRGFIDAVDKPYPLTPTLSQWERKRVDFVASSRNKQNRIGGELR